MTGRKQSREKEKKKATYLVSRFDASAQDAACEWSKTEGNNFTHC